MAMYNDYFDSPRRQPPTASLVWPLLFLALIAGFLVYRFWPERGPGGPDNNPRAALRPVTPAGKLGDMEDATIALYKRVKPSVVHIASTTVGRDALTRRLYKTREGLGSGFLWDNEGRIVTNFHVVEGANLVQVTLSDGSKWRARYVGGDANNDLAVLRIDAPKAQLFPIEVGDSKNLQIGQFAFAIGNPFGLNESLSSGIISALGRELEGENGRVLSSVIQTTAPINPGNSGGPLLDSSGRLIGVTTAILSPTGAWAGVGFAIPVDDVNRIVTGIIRGRD